MVATALLVAKRDAENINELESMDQTESLLMIIQRVFNIQASKNVPHAKKDTDNCLQMPSEHAPRRKCLQKTILPASSSYERR